MRTESQDIPEAEVDRLYEKLSREAEEGGYHLNPEAEFTRDLVRGLLLNEKRYGYPACPCRLAEGTVEKDRDIICPCDYRDPDLGDWGVCYCALYVSESVLKGDGKPVTIPERRPPEETREQMRAGKAAQPQPAGGCVKLAYPVWRCRVCGYLAARNTPPENCPVCKAKKDRFERFI